MGSYGWCSSCRCSKGSRVSACIDLLSCRSSPVCEYFGRDSRYFRAANPSAIERHIYSVPIPKTSDSTETRMEPKSLTDSSHLGFYDTSFSPEAGFYLLSYQGPNIPWQRVVRADDASEYLTPYCQSGG